MRGEAREGMGRGVRWTLIRLAVHCLVRGVYGVAWHGWHGYDAGAILIFSKVWDITAAFSYGLYFSLLCFLLTTVAPNGRAGGKINGVLHMHMKWMAVLNGQDGGKKAWG